MVEQVSWWLAFGAGVLSFVSPCSLPLYPSYLSYITGISVNQLKEKRRMREVMLHTVFFLIGFFHDFLCHWIQRKLVWRLF